MYMWKLKTDFKVEKSAWKSLRSVWREKVSRHRGEDGWGK